MFGSTAVREILGNFVFGWVAVREILGFLCTAGRLEYGSQAEDAHVGVGRVGRAAKTVLR